MSCRETENSTGIQAAAEVASYRHVSPEAQAHGVLQRVTMFCSVNGIRTTQRSGLRSWIIEIPVSVQLNVLLGCKYIVAGWNLVNSIEKRAHRMSTDFDRLGDRLWVPAGRHARGKQGLYLRCKI